MIPHLHLRVKAQLNTTSHHFTPDYQTPPFPFLLPSLSKMDLDDPTPPSSPTLTIHARNAGTNCPSRTNQKLPHKHPSPAVWSGNAPPLTVNLPCGFFFMRKMHTMQHTHYAPTHIFDRRAGGRACVRAHVLGHAADTVPACLAAANIALTWLVPVPTAPRFACACLAWRGGRECSVQPCRLGARELRVFIFGGEEWGDVMSIGIDSLVQYILVYIVCFGCCATGA
ncbi:hypothetical protein FB567DRAFT_231651 [Paraphoma chrysanthemicola]|uniref:Uncharacterized protein n=1 Tax=Paraphoma chrysanthemicola TaxID=798071 RepID=A0A8K0RBB8_9PLEO|nr:hypothetical protein FB567DRAFT_231651 [Paraphoma chrysanthemicola]